MNTLCIDTYIDERGREGKRENTPFNYFKVRVKFLNVMINNIGIEKNIYLMN